EGAAALFARLAEGRSCWEVCDLEQVPPDSPLLAAPAPAGFTAAVTDHDTRLVVPLPRTAEEYLASVPAWHRRNLRTAARRVAAALYSLVGHGRWCCYLSAFETGLEDLSPGALLLRAVIEQAIREGYREVDFLRGREPYKYVWGVREVVNRRLVLRLEAPDPA